MFCWICKPNTPKKETKEEEESSTMILTLICVKPDILINNHHKQSIASTTNFNQKLSQITGPTKHMIGINQTYLQPNMIYTYSNH